MPTITKQPTAPKTSKGAGWITGGHWVIIQAFSGKITVMGLLGPEGGHISAGGGKWDVVERPHNVGITEYKGRQNYELTLDLLIEGWVSRRQSPNGPVGPGTGRNSGLWIEGTLDQLRELADTPYTVRVIGAVPLWGRQWVITNMTYGDAIRDVVTGKRMRQQLTITFLEYIAPNDLAKLPRAPTPTRNYKIVKGDNLQKIATKQLKKASRWKEIEKLNKNMRGIKLDPKKFPVGKTIKIPAK